MKELILITGGSGLVGHCLLEEITGRQQELEDIDCIFLSSSSADLSDYKAARRVFERHRPQYVVHLAAKVGGLYANLEDSAGVFYKLNSQINENVLKLSYDFGVKKCLSCLSTCIFPDEIECPFDEKKIHDGPPHESNASYALAKRQLDLLNRKYNQLASGRNSFFFSIIPTNVYGPHDNFHPSHAHVIPDLIRRTHESICASDGKAIDLTVFGSGAPRRQFIYARDLADLIWWCLWHFRDFEQPSIILSPDECDELSIGQVAKLIVRIFGERFRCNATCLNFDVSKSDGQFKKTASNAKLKRLNPSVRFTPISLGLRETINWYCTNYPHVRPAARSPPFNLTDTVKLGRS